MQTPEREENLPSSPYAITKEEFNNDDMQIKSNRLQPSHATMKALFPLYEIMRCSINLKIDNEYNSDLVN